MLLQRKYSMFKDKLNIYKLIAFIGTIIMGIASFMACLSVDSLIVNIGNALLILSIAVLFYAYSYWQP